MKKIILVLLLIFGTFLYSKTFEAKYNVTYGDFLTLGIATSKLNINNNLYKIIVNVKTTGFAKFVSNNRIETYESHGKIIKNKFVPNKYIKIKKDNNKRRVKTHTFDYKKNMIYIKDEIFEKTKIYDQSMNLVEKDSYYINKEELDYFAKDDILSLFFNVKDSIKHYKHGEKYSLYAVGANKTKGLINIFIPSAIQKIELDKALPTNDRTKFIASINQDIFQSDKGELLISLNNYGFCTLAILKDVLFFGDIIGEMIDFKIDDKGLN